MDISDVLDRLGLGISTQQLSCLVLGPKGLGMLGVVGLVSPLELCVGLLDVSFGRWGSQGVCGVGGCLQ